MIIKKLQQFNLVYILALASLSFHTTVLAPGPAQTITVQNIIDTIRHIREIGEILTGEALQTRNEAMSIIQSTANTAHAESWTEEKVVEIFTPLLRSLNAAIQDSREKEHTKALQIWEDLFQGKAMIEQDINKLITLDPVNLINVLAGNKAETIFNAERLLEIIKQYPGVNSIFNLSLNYIIKQMKETFKLDNSFFEPESGKSSNFHDILEKFISVARDKKISETVSVQIDENGEELIHADNPPSTAPTGNAASNQPTSSLVVVNSHSLN